jgi:hypothetical protein
MRATAPGRWGTRAGSPPQPPGPRLRT